MALGREPNAEEIAEATGIEPEEVDSIKRSAQAPISLEKPMGDEEQSEFGQLIARRTKRSLPRARRGDPDHGGAARRAREPLLSRASRARAALRPRRRAPETLDEVGRGSTSHASGSARSRPSRSRSSSTSAKRSTCATTSDRFRLSAARPWTPTRGRHRAALSTSGAQQPFETPTRSPHELSTNPDLTASIAVLGWVPTHVAAAAIPTRVPGAISAGRAGRCRRARLLRERRDRQRAARRRLEHLGRLLARSRAELDKQVDTIRSSSCLWKRTWVKNSRVPCSPNQASESASPASGPEHVQRPRHRRSRCTMPPTARRRSSASSCP